MQVGAGRGGRFVKRPYEGTTVVTGSPGYVRKFMLYSARAGLRVFLAFPSSGVYNYEKPAISLV